jgi:hypothetical protein
VHVPPGEHVAAQAYVAPEGWHTDVEPEHTPVQLPQ